MKGTLSDPVNYLFVIFYCILHVYIYATVEVIKILSLDFNDEKLSDLHHKFLGHLWEVFNAVCRSLNELRYLVSLLLYRATKHIRTFAYAVAKCFILEYVTH